MYTPRQCGSSHGTAHIQKPPPHSAGCGPEPTAVWGTRKPSTPQGRQDTVRQFLCEHPEEEVGEVPEAPRVAVSYHERVYRSKKLTIVTILRNRRTYVCTFQEFTHAPTPALDRAPHCMLHNPSPPHTHTNSYANHSHTTQCHAPIPPTKALMYVSTVHAPLCNMYVRMYVHYVAMFVCRIGVLTE